MRRKEVLILIMLSVVLVFGSVFLSAHEHVGEADAGLCEHELMTADLYRVHPNARPENNPAFERLEAFTREFVRERQMRRALGMMSAEALQNNTIIIPTVFHIIHQNGEENISDAQVMSALQALNEDYNNQNPGIGTLHPAFWGLEGNVGFSFQLPARDPDGNPTTGINRYYDANYATGNNVEMKRTYGWPQHMYLNIYVVKSASGGSSSGFAYFPATANDYPEYDGLVLSHWACGTTGTAISTHYRLISHEVGHWANLSHTWGDNSQQGTRRACREDDHVEDTPNCTGFWGGDPDGAGNNGCFIDRVSCDSLDMIQNHMDYSFCPIVFTVGQADRMQAALNSTVARRNNLWSPANLAAVGLGDPVPSNEIYVAGIAMSLGAKGKNAVADAVISVKDVDGSPVTGATVSFEWSGIVTATGSAVTGADGSVTVTSPSARGNGTFTITVTNVTHGADTYNPSLNVKTSDSISN